MSQEVETPAQEVESNESQVQHEEPESKDVNNRLLEESKKYKSRYQEYKQKWEQLNESILEKEGDVQTKLEHEKSKREELEQSLMKERGERLKRDVKLMLSKHAKDAVDIDDLVLHPKVKDIVRYDDETMEIDEDSIKEAVKVMRESKPYYFDAKGVRTQVNGSPLQKTVEKPISDKEKFSASIKSLFS